jgi:hypothetical protein
LPDGLIDVNLATEPGIALCFAFETSRPGPTLPENTGVNVSVARFMVTTTTGSLKTFPLTDQTAKSGTLFPLLPSAEQDDKYNG